MIIEFLNKKINAIQNLPAIISEDTRLNYFEFIKRINTFSKQLLNYKIVQDEHIAIICDNNPNLVIILFALWEISAVPVILNHKLTDEELEKLIIHSNSKKILTHENFKNRLPGLNKIIFPFHIPAAIRINPKFNYPNNNKTNLILYTSGTTGHPKGVMLSLKNLISSAKNSGAFFNFKQDDKWLVSLPLYHIGGIQILVRSVCYYSSMIIPKSLKTNDIIEAMKKFKPTQISLVPTVLSRLLNNNIIPYPHLKNIFLGGGPAGERLVQKAIQKNWNIVKVYGSTETSSMVTSLIIKDKPEKVTSAGKPLKPNKIMIVDHNRAPLPVNKIGEIVAEGNSIMLGYWNDKEETRKKLSGNKFFTGDLGYIDEDGYLYITSRKDNTIISGGENINPAEIEEAILNHPEIRQVCVVGIEDDEWGQIVTAVIVKKKSSSITEKKIVELLKKTIAKFKIPKKILFVDKIPLTALGKVKLGEIRKLLK